MNKADMLKEIEESLNVVNKGLFNADDFDDGNTEEIREIHEMVTGRNQDNGNRAVGDHRRAFKTEEMKENTYDTI